MRHILVTGGCGYIGCHTVKKLLSEEWLPVVIDDLSTSSPEFIEAAGVPFAKGRIGDDRFVSEILRRYPIEGVIHLAASAYVEESMLDPGKYYENNVKESSAFFQILIQHGIKKLVHSSSCAVYGNPSVLPIVETAARIPISPYGESKVLVEKQLADVAKSGHIASISLRYFNAAGADPNGEIGESHEPETHLIPRILQSISQRKGGLVINGTDYATPDGTCIRDFVHVCDLAKAHVQALNVLSSRHVNWSAINLGSGAAKSVREIVAIIERVTGEKVAYKSGVRRPGDPASLYADTTLAAKLLNWSPDYDVEDCIRHAWQWEKKMVCDVRPGKKS